MIGGDYTGLGDLATIKTPELSEWKCYLFGGDQTGIVWRPLKGQEPNWFWRWMQFVCFGNRWERVRK